MINTYFILYWLEIRLWCTKQRIINNSYVLMVIAIIKLFKYLSIVLIFNINLMMQAAIEGSMIVNIFEGIFL